MIIDSSDSPTEATLTVKTVKTVPVTSNANNPSSKNNDSELLHKMREKLDTVPRRSLALI